MSALFNIPQVISSMAANLANTAANVAPVGHACKIIRIYGNAQGDAVSLAEVEAWNVDGKNAASAQNGGVATQSSTAAGGVASRAIDGHTSGFYADGSVTHTDSGAGEYWQVSIVPQVIKSVAVFNRKDCCSDRLAGARLVMYDQNGDKFFEQILTAAATQQILIPADAAPTTAISQITANTAANVAHVGNACKIIRIYGNAQGDAVSLAEVKAWNVDGKNAASAQNGGVATQSSTAAGGVASRAIDGHTSGFYADGSVTHTDSGAGEYWQVSIVPQVIKSVAVFNRKDCCSDRLAGARLVMYDQNGDKFFEQILTAAATQQISADAAPTTAISQITANTAANVAPVGHACKIIRIYGNANGDAVVLAEVEAWNVDGKNAASAQNGGVATQSSTYQGLLNGVMSAAVASKAIDGNTSGNWLHGSVTRTASGAGEYWQVSIVPQVIKSVVVFNRTGANSGGGLAGAKLAMYDTNGDKFFEQILTAAATQQIWIPANAAPTTAISQIIANTVANTAANVAPITKSVTSVQQLIAANVAPQPIIAVSPVNAAVQQLQNVADTLTTNVLVHTLPATTDALTELKYVDESMMHTSALFSWDNPSTNPATFRVITASSDYLADYVVRSTEVTVAGGESGTALATGLLAGNLYFFYLQRLENKTWAKQSSTRANESNLHLGTGETPIVNTYTTSEDAIFEWTRTHTAEYTVEVYQSATLRETGATPFRTIGPGDITLENNKWGGSVTGLTENKTYYGVLSSNERVGSGTQIVDITEFEFDASARADLIVGTVGASFADLSWDTANVGADENDGEADFQLAYWELVGENFEDKGTLMETTPDTTRNFRAKGLKPGTTYRVSLDRLKVTAGYTTQDNKTFTTRGSALTISDVATTNFRAMWGEVSPDARYKTVFETPGRFPSVSVGFNLESVAKLLTADTTYTVKLFVEENDADVLLDTVSVLTDKNAILSLNEAKNSLVDLQVRAFTESAAASTYYIKNTSDTVISAEFNVNDPSTPAAELTKQVELGGVSDGTHELTLYRKEKGHWVAQSSVSVTTLSASVITSVSTQAALVKWDNQYEGAEYQVSVLERAGGQVLFSVDHADIIADGGQRSVVVDGLAKNTTYFGELLVREGGVITKIADFDFKTSVSATFVVNKVYASYAEVTWDDNGVGLDEEDNEAEFRVYVTNEASETRVFDSGWISDSVSSATATGLTPGDSYSAVLLRRGVDGNAVQQAAIALSAKTTTMSVAQLTSSFMTVNWPSIYENAQYQLDYSKAGEEPATLGGGGMTATTAELQDLRPNTEYLLELYVVEGGVPLVVTTATLGAALGTSSSTGGGFNMTAAAVLVLALLLVLLLVVVRKRM